MIESLAHFMLPKSDEVDKQTDKQDWIMKFLIAHLIESDCEHMHFAAQAARTQDSHKQIRQLHEGISRLH